MKLYKETRILRWSPLLLLITITLCILSYFYWDILITLHFFHSGATLKSFANVITQLISPQLNYVLFAFLFILFQFWLKMPSWAHRFFIIFMSILASNIITGALKDLFGRARPELLISKGIYGLFFFSHSNSFNSLPSGHSCTAGAIFGALACFWPSRTLYFMIAAYLCALSRVILLEHYFSDILLGTAIGFLTSQIVYTFVERKKRAAGR